MKKRDFKTTIFQDRRTIFSLNELGMLLDESDFESLKQKANYYVSKKVIVQLRRGIYAKQKYNKEELAGKIYNPSYISLEYVLQKAGVIFQYAEQLTIVSYLSRRITVDKHPLAFRKIKNEILLNTTGLVRDEGGVNIARPERAFLDLLYLNKHFYFDNPGILDKELITKLLPIYGSKQLALKVKRVFGDA